MFPGASEIVMTATHPHDGAAAASWSDDWPQTPGEFKLLVDAFGERLVRYAYRRLGNLPDAEDVVQKVFLKAFTKRARYRKIHHVGPYLYRMTANACIDWQRYRGRRREESLDERVSGTIARDGPDAAERAFATEEQLCMERLLDELPRRQAEVIRLRVYGGLAFADIAAAAGASEATVKSRFRYGLEKLKVKLSGRKEENS
ncbi:MAG: RNA polymerase sigma factor [Candidatus Omnitrophica bacterium]|nr:RNA polymerase sigma factor [Candidatus Omnitrophota bacterium]